MVIGRASVGGIGATAGGSELPPVCLTPDLGFGALSTAGSRSPRRCRPSPGLRKPLLVCRRSRAVGSLFKDTNRKRRTLALDR